MGFSILAKKQHFLRVASLSPSCLPLVPVPPWCSVLYVLVSHLSLCLLSGSCSTMVVGVKRSLLTTCLCCLRIVSVHLPSFFSLCLPPVFPLVCFGKGCCSVMIVHWQSLTPFEPQLYSASWLEKTCSSFCFFWKRWCPVIIQKRFCAPFILPFGRDKLDRGKLDRVDKICWNRVSLMIGTSAMQRTLVQIGFMKVSWTEIIR